LAVLADGKPVTSARRISQVRANLLAHGQASQAARLCSAAQVRDHLLKHGQLVRSGDSPAPKLLEVTADQQLLVEIDVVDMEA
jgi:hypothetical protein